MLFDGEHFNREAQVDLVALKQLHKDAEKARSRNEKQMNEEAETAHSKLQKRLDERKSRAERSRAQPLMSGSPDITDDEALTNAETASIDKS